MCKSGRDRLTLVIIIGIRLLASIIAEIFEAAKNAASKSGTSSVVGSESINRVTVALSKRVKSNSDDDEEEKGKELSVVTPNPRQILSKVLFEEEKEEERISSKGCFS